MIRKELPFYILHKKKSKWVPDSEYNIVALFVCGGPLCQSYPLENKDEWND